MHRLLTLVLALAACGGLTTATVDLPEDIRTQLHVVAGHEPDVCVDLRETEAIIEITNEGFAPECSILGRDQPVVVRNGQSTDDTWIVADPETEAEMGRHVRLVLEVAAGADASVDRIGEWAGTGVWPCYGRESRHQCRIVVVP